MKFIVFFLGNLTIGFLEVIMRLPSERKRFDAFELERKKCKLKNNLQNEESLDILLLLFAIKSESLFKNLKRTDKCGRYE